MASTTTETRLESVPFWIDGAPYHASSGATFAVHSAKEGKAVLYAESADAAIANRAAESSQRALPGWKSYSASARRDIIERFAALLLSRQQELIDAQVKETSCSESWARFNVVYGTSTIKEVASRVTTVCTGSLPPTSAPGVFGMVVKEPIGVALLIAPWNAAVTLAARSMAAIFAAGCTLVFKASEMCPKTHHLLRELWIEAGLPAKAISVVQTRREDGAAVTEALISHRAIRKVEFIGSASVGRAIGSLAGKHLKPILMELGGKCAAIVLKDANLQAAAKKCIAGAFINHGQVCYSTERIILEKTIAQDFIELLKKEAAAWPAEQGVNARIVKASYNKLLDAQNKGAQFLFGKPELASDTSLAPAILTATTKEMDMWDEETFGPSTTVRIVDDEDAAVDAVNESNYGLDACIFTRDMRKAIDIAGRLEVGRVRVNAPGQEATFPIGPVKDSGYGANNASRGIEEFLVEKVISMTWD